MMGGHADYTRFLVLGRSRTGSNFLLGLLNTHDGVVAYGEILKNYESIDWGHMNYRPSQKTALVYQEHPQEFLENVLFRKYPKHISAVGFKLFYYHAQEDGRKSVWDYLQSRNDIAVIHIKRLNILKTHLSRKRADLSNAWVNTTGSKEISSVVTLDYAECLADFIRTRAWEQEFDRFFSGHPMLEVIYENLASDYKSVMGSIQEFLNVKSQAIQPMTFKQSVEPLSEAISNYYELKEQFKGSAWESFFDE